MRFVHVVGDNIMSDLELPGHMEDDKTVQVLIHVPYAPGVRLQPVTEEGVRSYSWIPSSRPDQPSSFFAPMMHGQTIRVLHHQDNGTRSPIARILIVTYSRTGTISAAYNPPRTSSARGTSRRRRRFTAESVGGGLTEICRSPDVWSPPKGRP